MPFLLAPLCLPSGVLVSAPLCRRNRNQVEYYSPREQAKEQAAQQNYSQTKPDAMEMRFLRGDCFVRQLSNCRTMPIPRTRNYAYENNDTGTAEVHLTRLISKPQNQSMRAETSLFLLFTLSQDHTEGRPASLSRRRPATTQSGPQLGFRLANWTSMTGCNR